jgi:hypothetical protein
MASLRKFDPEEFDDDIYVQSVQGLGRGRGFRVTQRQSILLQSAYSEARRKIADRIIELLSILKKNGDVSTDGLAKRLYLSDDTEAQAALVEEDLDDLVRTAGLSPSSYKTLEEKFEALKEELGSLRAQQD